MRLVRILVALAALPLAALPPRVDIHRTVSSFIWPDRFGPNPGRRQCRNASRNRYDSVFAPSEQLEVGIPGPARFSILFDNPDDVSAYLPAIGMSGPSPLICSTPPGPLPALLAARFSRWWSTSHSLMPACWRIRLTFRSVTSCFRTSIRRPSPAPGAAPTSVRKSPNSTG